MSNHHRRVRDIQPAPEAHAPIIQAGPTSLKVLLSFLAVVVLAISGMGYFTIGRLGGEVASASNLNLGGGEKKHVEADGAVDILLVGTDSRSDALGNRLTQEELERLHAGFDDGEENTDTMIVLRVPADGTQATAVSIPRDTYVADDEFGNLKMNGIYGTHKAAKTSEMINSGVQYSEQEIHEESVKAGRSALLSAVADLTGVNIDHYAEVGLYGFVLLTDAVGGVDVCLNEAVDDEFSGARFHAGEQTLDGVQALSFVRQRHGLPRGDFDRIVRQQAFLASLVNKVLSTNTLTNPQRLSELSTAAERSLVIDDGWDLASFATQMADLAGGNMTFTTIPVTSVDGVGDYGESVVTVNPAEVRAFFNNLVAEEVPPAEAAPNGEAPGAAPTQLLGPALAGSEIHVLNAGDTTGHAARVGSWLQEQQATIAEVANAQPGIYTMSQVVAADPSSPAAIELAELLGGLPITSNAGLDDTSLVVVVSSDYFGPISNQPLTDLAPLAPEEQVGIPGADFGQTEKAPEIDAGGSGPRCVN